MAGLLPGGGADLEEVSALQEELEVRISLQTCGTEEQRDSTHCILHNPHVREVKPCSVASVISSKTLYGAALKLHTIKNK